MESYKLNGKKFSMPTGWHDVSYANAMTILEDDLNEIEAFCLLSGMSLDEASKIEDYETVVYFMRSFGFLSKRPDPVNAHIPLSIKFGDDTVLMPAMIYEDTDDMGKMTIGQINDLKDVYKQSLLQLKSDEEDWKPTELEMLSIMPNLVAIYVQKIVDGEYDKGKALAMDIENSMSFKDVANMGYFFLKRLNGFMNGSGNTFQKHHKIRRKLKQAYRTLMRSMVSMAH